MNTTTNAVLKEECNTVSDEQGIKTALNHLQIISLHAPEGYLELRAFSDKGRDGEPGRYWLSTKADESELRKAVEWAKQQSERGRGVFVSMNPRAMQAGTKAAVKQLVAAYVDLDCEKHGVSREAALMRIEQAPVRPDLVVDSGRGLHVVHFFEPVEDKAAWETVQAGLTDFYTMVGADVSLRTDYARVLRLAGFPNQKEETPRETRIVRFLPLESPYRLADVAASFGVTERTGPTKAADVWDSEEESVISEGAGRNTYIFSRVRKLAKDGSLSRSQAYLVAEAYNEAKCSPALDDEEFDAVFARAWDEYENSDNDGGESRERFERQLTAAGEELARQSAPLVLSFRDLQAQTFEQPEFVVKCLPRGKVGMVAARPNAGKTTILRNIGESVATGRQFLDIVPAGRPRRVLYFDLETPWSFVQTDLKLSALYLSDEEREVLGQNFFVIGEEAFYQRFGDMVLFNDPEGFTVYDSIIGSYRPELVILDTVSTACQLADENSSTDVGAVMKMLEKVAVKHNAAVLFSHHAGKAQEQGNRSNDDADGMFDFSGSSAFVRLPVMSFTIGQRKAKSGETLTRIKAGKMKLAQAGRIENQWAQLIHDARWFESVSEEEASRVVVDKEDMSILIATLVGDLFKQNGRAVTTREVQEAAEKAPYNLGRTSVFKGLKGARETGCIKYPKGKTGQYIPALVAEE